MRVMHSKNLTKLDKIVHNLNEKEHNFFMEMLQREEIGGSKGNQN